MNREYHKWYSGSLGREMELLIFGHAGKAVLFFPPRMGRFYDYENWGMIAAFSERINCGELQVYCVDSVDIESFYNDNADAVTKIDRYLQYEQYILDEVIPFMHGKNPDHDLEAAGCSMGAYHAANMVFKHPHFFNKLVCMSGRFDLTQSIAYFRDLFNGYHNENIYFNMPRQYMYNLNDGHILDRIRHIEIIIAIGNTDPFKEDNIGFSQLLADKGIAHQFYIWNGFAHNARNWKKMVQLYL